MNMLRLLGLLGASQSGNTDTKASKQREGERDGARELETERERNSKRERERDVGAEREGERTVPRCFGLEVMSSGRKESRQGKKRRKPWHLVAQAQNIPINPVSPRKAPKDLKLLNS